MSDVLIENCLAQAERSFACADGPPSTEDAYGNEYIIVVSGGVRRSGEHVPALFHTEEQAAAEWLRALHCAAVARNPDAYLRRKKMRLWWRCKPEMQQLTRYTKVVPRNDGTVEVAGVERWYTVYARLSFGALVDNEVTT